MCSSQSLQVNLFAESFGFMSTGQVPFEGRGRHRLSRLRGFFSPFPKAKVQWVVARAKADAACPEEDESHLSPPPQRRQRCLQAQSPQPDPVSPRLRTEAESGLGGTMGWSTRQTRSWDGSACGSRLAGVASVRADSRCRENRRWSQTLLSPRAG